MKPIKTFSFLFTLLFVGSLAAPAQATAQDMSIGFVDPQTILSRMPEMRAVQQRLQNFAERKQRELQDKERELQTEIELYQQKANVISDQARETEEERLGQMDLDLRQMQNQVRQEIQEQQANLMSPLLQQMQEAIDTVAQQRNLDYVLNTTTSSGDAIILYVSDEVQSNYDITDAVMLELGI